MKMIVMSTRVIPALGAVSALLVALVAGCGDANNPATAGGSSGNLEVVASFYPLQFVTQKIGGDRVRVATLTAPGVEPHDIELPAKQVGSLAEADLVVYEKGLQPAVDEAAHKTPPTPGSTLAVPRGWRPRRGPSQLHRSGLGLRGG
jgi:zinc transport system substrate-binding protein